MEHFDDFEGFWREEFEDFESEPRPEEWERIRERLHPKRRILPIWWFATAAMLVGSGLFVWRMIDTKEVVLNNDITINNQSQSIDNQKINIVTNTNIQKPNIELNKTLYSDLKPNIAPANSGSTIPKNKTPDITLSQKSQTLETPILSEHKSNPIKDEAISTMPKEVEKELVKTRDAIAKLAVIEILQPALLNFLSEKNIEKVAIVEVLEIKKPVNRKMPLKLVASAGLSSNYRNITPLTYDNILLTNVEVPNFTSIHRIGWQANLGLQIPITKHWALRSGVNYQGFLANMNYKLTYPEVVASSVRGSVTSSGFQISDISYESELKSENKTYHTIGIQADLMCFFNTKNALSAGASIGRLIGDAQKQKTLFLNAAYLHRFQRFSAEPFFRYHLKNYQTTDNYYTFQPYSFGVNVGF